MAQFQIPLNDDLLHGLFQGDGGVARLLEAVQVTEQLQAAPYERTEQRQGYRSGA
ncbi:hypothetical protein PYK22_01419 [Pyrinomonas methylaliphatogenes]|uniref:Transposase, Mutator family n=1 Tax=Pyrinomonas methylaliphatogenes TaxID=454194 RepID=A0A0B6WZ28_9BACT|nr:hypothetical protein PYK22_01419 [Pyrinomonas methylaliphatogenes]